MSLIKCAYDCSFQHDGYCCLDSISAVTDAKAKCPHYKKSEHVGNGFMQIADSDNLDIRL